MIMWELELQDSVEKGQVTPGENNWRLTAVCMVLR
jgi:hypothetical protein